MSTLSDQSRKLRGWAAQFAEREEQFGVVSRALVKDLEEAADTILRMRDNLREADRCRNIELEENAKLRELCLHLYTCICYCDREASDGGCVLCPYQFVENDCSFEERLLELGIEVES